MDKRKILVAFYATVLTSCIFASEKDEGVSHSTSLTSSFADDASDNQPKSAPFKSEYQEAFTPKEPKAIRVAKSRSQSPVHPNQAGFEHLVESSHWEKMKEGGRVSSWNKNDVCLTLKLLMGIGGIGSSANSSQRDTMESIVKRTFWILAAHNINPFETSNRDIYTEADEGKIKTSMSLAPGHFAELNKIWNEVEEAVTSGKTPNPRHLGARKDKPTAAYQKQQIIHDLIRLQSDAEELPSIPKQIEEEEQRLAELENPTPTVLSSHIEAKMAQMPLKDRASLEHYLGVRKSVEKGHKRIASLDKEIETLKNELSEIQASIAKHGPIYTNPYKTLLKKEELRKKQILRSYLVGKYGSPNNIGSDDESLASAKEEESQKSDDESLASAEEGESQKKDIHARITALEAKLAKKDDLLQKIRAQKARLLALDDRFDFEAWGLGFIGDDAELNKLKQSTDLPQTH